MSSVIKVSDQTDLALTKDFPYAHFPFEKFNPVQSRLVDFFEGNSNVAIAAATSAGKTICAEMYLSYELSKRGGKGAYITPLKALAQEKLDDWRDVNHHFFGKNLSICTGDYRLTPTRKKELDESDLIIMTSEMLSSRCRNFKSEKNSFLSQIKTLVVDESHLIAVPGRGDHLENAIMKITQINPDVRLVLLSATMPNVDEICEWVSKLTGRDTYYLESQYRPCPLNIHYETYFDATSKYDELEMHKIEAALKLIKEYKDDKFLLFVHTKRTGELVKDALKLRKIDCEFHNANLSLEKRLQLEKRFKEDKNFRILVATSTIAWGVNLPARRVIVLGVHRGLQEVENYDIKQMVGRAGRPKYDPQGDAHILLPRSKESQYVYKLSKDTYIKSQMLEDASGQGHYKVLAFHLVSEIHSGNVKTIDDIHSWYHRTLAYHQEQELSNDIVDRVIDLLVKCKAIVEEDGIYSCTSIGVIASMYYFSPFDVADLKNNFRKIFNNDKENDDFWLSIALANLDTHKFGIVNKVERAEMATYQSKINRIFGKDTFLDPVIKVGCAYFNMLNGREVPVFSALSQGLKIDASRLFEVIKAVDDMSGKWDKRGYLDGVEMRLMYGVKPELVELCKIPNIGKVRAEKLHSMKIDTVEKFIKYGAKLPSLLNMSKEKVEESLSGARSLQLKDMLGY